MVYRFLKTIKPLCKWHCVVQETMGCLMAEINTDLEPVLLEDGSQKENNK